ncbi:hypothetical protein EJM73_19570 [Clostridium botulinum]|uniref:hypothetical protein n=1 Tax=Clostridium botulinum TaxID=1491 RepID=UPI0013759360|nr:hypothetical protein [Clostridium botulinum]NCI22148.1 hypothetical protein [Clostridium botulinum]NCI37812.1 hypothetical protein [Clostridium botulinum]NCI74458.1 hypothetical protein [Clostridium botulinum]NDI40933.1 hypothetical protein [Clostridium botulinum]NFA13559.1 hypothetical protein [Clostridium botulinum]
MPEVPPANFPPPKPPGQGRNTLISKQEATNIYHKACIDYVNEKIKHSCKNRITTVDLEVKYLYSELMERLNKEYRFLCSTDNYVTFRIV